MAIHTRVKATSNSKKRENLPSSLVRSTSRSFFFTASIFSVNVRSSSMDPIGLCCRTTRKRLEDRRWISLAKSTMQRRTPCFRTWTERSRSRCRAICNTGRRKLRGLRCSSAALEDSRASIRGHIKRSVEQDLQKSVSTLDAARLRTRPLRIVYASELRCGSRSGIELSVADGRSSDSSAINKAMHYYFVWHRQQQSEH
jgi:hypothetical protein